jgi:hypothetical protein
MRWLREQVREVARAVAALRVADRLRFSSPPALQ